MIAPNDSTWANFDFNKGTFVWDGSSNIVIGMHRCNNPGMALQYNYAEFLVTNVRPPNPPNYSSYWPWNAFYSYTFNGGNCNTLSYYTNMYMYSYSYVTYVSQYKAFRPLVRLRVSAGVSQSFPDDVDPRRILRAGSVYDGSSAAFPKPSLTFYQQVGKQYTLTYKITGPAPSENVVYTATQGGNSTVTYTGNANGYTTYPFTRSNGYLWPVRTELLTSRLLRGGSYRVEATFQFGLRYTNVAQVLHHCLPE